jgi:hypothetical protein
MTATTISPAPKAKVFGLLVSGGDGGGGTYFPLAPDDDGLGRFTWSLVHSFESTQRCDVNNATAVAPTAAPASAAQARWRAPKASAISILPVAVLGSPYCKI